MISHTTFARGASSLACLLGICFVLRTVRADSKLLYRGRITFVPDDGECFAAILKGADGIEYESHIYAWCFKGSGVDLDHPNFAAIFDEGQNKLRFVLEDGSPRTFLTEEDYKRIQEEVDEAFKDCVFR